MRIYENIRIGNTNTAKTGDLVEIDLNKFPHSYQGLGVLLSQNDFEGLCEVLIFKYGEITQTYHRSRLDKYEV